MGRMEDPADIRLLRYLEIAGDWAFELNAAGIITFCHKSSTATYPHLAQDMVGKHFSEYLTRHNSRRAEEMLRNCSEKKMRQSITYIDGTGCHIELAAICHLEEDCCVGFYMLVKNLSQRLHADIVQRDSARICTDIDMPQSPVEQPKLPVHTQDPYAESVLQLQLRQLDLVGRFLNADRMYLFKRDTTAETYHCLHEWCSQGTQSIQDAVQESSWPAGTALIERLCGNDFVAVDDMKRLPKESRRPDDQNVKAFLCVPVVLDDVLWGFLGADFCRATHHFASDEIHMLQTMAGITQSVLEKHRMEREIAQAYSKLDAIVKNYPGFIWCLDNEYNLTLCEGMPLPGTNIDVSQFAGRNLRELDGEGRSLMLYAKATLEQGPQSYVLELCGRYIACNTNPMRDENGSVVGQIGIAQDITELHRMQLKLEQAIDDAQRASLAKSEFLSRMSHEIRTPMNAITGMNAIARKTKDPNRIQYCLEKIESTSAQLLGLINDILDMSKIESGKFEIAENEFDFETMLQNVCNVVTVKLQEKQQNFAIDFDDVFLRYIVSDELRLGQIMINLLTNASKFTPQNGDITLKIRHLPLDDEHSQLHVEVWDTGIGVSKEQRERLFLPFEQADGSTTRKYGGTGLGLAICKKICMLMNGNIWMENRAEGGSRFIFEVRVGWGGELAREAPSAGFDLAKLRVLIVHEQEDARAYLRNLLLTFSLRNSLAKNGKEALLLLEQALLEQDPFGLVLLDWKAHGPEEHEIAHHIETLTGGSTSVIVLSSLEASAVENQSAAGISRFLPKPVLPSQLFNAITEVMTCSLVTEHAELEREPLRWQRRAILLAEDIELNREILTGILEDTGVRVDCAVNGLEAVELYSNAPYLYDLVLMDIQMPEMDGLCATTKIRESGLPRCVRIPIFAMTANAFQSDIEKCLAAGMNDHIAKPINVKELFEKLGAILD